MKTTVFIVLVASILLCSTAFAEPYKSGKFPSDELLLKYVNNKSNSDFIAVIGKIETSPNQFVVFFSKKPGDDFVYDRRITKLDTNIWLYGDAHIIQK